MSNLSYYTKKYKRYLLTKGNIIKNNALTNINNLVYYMNKLEQNINYSLDKLNLYFNYKHRMGILDNLNKLPIIELLKLKDYLNYNYTNLIFIKTNIIIIPNYLVEKWKLLLTLTNLNYLIIYKKNQFKPKLENYNYINLLIITNTKYDEFCNYYKDIDKFIFSRVIYDEADTLSIDNCKKLNSLFYWFLTNTSINLLFPLGYFYNKDYLKINIPGLKYSGFIKNTFYNLEVNSYNEINKFYCKLKNINNNKENISIKELDKNNFVNCLKFNKLLIVDPNNKINHKKYSIHLFNKNKYKRLTLNKINVLLLKDYNSYNGLDLTVFNNILFVNCNQFIQNYIIHKINCLESIKFFKVNYL